MPVTAKLSRALYDKLGDVVVGELVDWFNMVDATYRFDLRELNELNFARFDAKLEQRAVELMAAIERRTTELRADFERGLAELRTDVQGQLVELRADFAGQLAGLRTDLERQITDLRIEMNAGFARSDARMPELETRLTKRMFGFWVAQAATTAGLVLGVVKLLG